MKPNVTILDESLLKCEDDAKIKSGRVKAMEGSKPLTLVGMVTNIFGSVFSLEESKPYQSGDRNTKHSNIMDKDCFPKKEANEKSVLYWDRSQHQYISDTLLMIDSESESMCLLDLYKEDVLLRVGGFRNENA